MKLRLKLCSERPIQFRDDPGIVIDAVDLKLSGCVIFRPQETLTQDQLSAVAKRIQLAIGKNGPRALVVNKGIDILEAVPELVENPETGAEGAEETQQFPCIVCGLLDHVPEIFYLENNESVYRCPNGEIPIQGVSTLEH